MLLVASYQPIELEIEPDIDLNLLLEPSKSCTNGRGPWHSMKPSEKPVVVWRSSDVFRALVKQLRLEEQCNHDRVFSRDTD